MLISDYNNPVGRVFLGLTNLEAAELIDKLSHMIEHPDYHHDHLEDFENQGILDVSVLGEVVPESFHASLVPDLLALRVKGEPLYE